MGKELSIEEILEQERFDPNVLKAILYYSRTNDEYKFPTIEQFVLSELTNAVVEYLTGNQNSIRYEQSCFDYSKFEKSIDKLRTEYLTETQTKISETVRNSINRMIELKIRDNLRHPGTLLYDIYKRPFGLGICDNDFFSIDSFSEDLIRKIESEVLPLLSDKEKSDCQAIGRVMRKYIEEDLRYIKANYPR